MSLIIVLAYIAVLLAIIMKIIANEGWSLTPAFEVDGKFQINIILIIAISFVSAVAIINTVPLTGALSTVLISLFTIFMSVYGTPTVVDTVLTAVLPKHKT